MFGVELIRRVVVRAADYGPAGGDSELISLYDLFLQLDEVLWKD